MSVLLCDLFISGKTVIMHYYLICLKSNAGTYGNLCVAETNRLLSVEAINKVFSSAILSAC